MKIISKILRFLNRLSGFCVGALISFPLMPFLSLDYFIFGQFIPKFQRDYIKNGFVPTVVLFAMELVAWLIVAPVLLPLVTLIGATMGGIVGARAGLKNSFIAVPRKIFALSYALEYIKLGIKEYKERKSKGIDATTSNNEGNVERQPVTSPPVYVRLNDEEVDEEEINPQEEEPTLNRKKKQVTFADEEEPSVGTSSPSVSTTS